MEDRVRHLQKGGVVGSVPPGRHLSPKSPSQARACRLTRRRGPNQLPSSKSKRRENVCVGMCKIKVTPLPPKLTCRPGSLDMPPPRVRLSFARRYFQTPLLPPFTGSLDLLSSAGRLRRGAARNGSRALAILLNGESSSEERKGGRCVLSSYGLTIYLVTCSRASHACSMHTNPVYIIYAPLCANFQLHI